MPPTECELRETFNVLPGGKTQKDSSIKNQQHNEESDNQHKY